MREDPFEMMDRRRMGTSAVLAALAVCAWPLGWALGAWTWQGGVACAGVVLFVWAVTERRYVVARRRLVRHMERRNRMVAMSDRVRTLRIMDPTWGDDDCGGAA